MKKLLCVILSVLCVLTLFAACEQKPAETSTDASLPVLDETGTADTQETQGIHYKGITSSDVTPEILETAEGRPMDVEDKAGENTMYIYNNVEYLGITYPQLQCILFDNRATITLTYKLSQGETTEAAMETVSATITPVFGEPSKSTGGTFSYSWRDAEVNENYINLYVLTDTELKLCFTLNG